MALVLMALVMLGRILLGALFVRAFFLLLIEMWRLYSGGQVVYRDYVVKDIIVLLVGGFFGYFCAYFAHGNGLNWLWFVTAICYYVIIGMLELRLKSQYNI